MPKATVNYHQKKTHMMSAVDRSFTDQSTLQEDEQLGLSCMDAHGYSPRGDQRSGGVTEASSLLGGSPRRPCGRKGSPYHTGQLHPAVRVADLLQHINQMKTEGYGFKQEYEPRQNRSMDVLLPGHCLPLLISTHRDPNSYINVALTDVRIPLPAPSWGLREQG
ncbi:receptor-type tyrosine-protein phosphatase U-like [Dasypus novemcinctus]|uniref:receptor-type tyrosine-protein phosphatase U-like n=1 Tax=Dasypus novemcinctus TaxID=9361 RepID=UPI0039C98C3E